MTGDGLGHTLSPENLERLSSGGELIYEGLKN